MSLFGRVFFRLVWCVRWLPAGSQALQIECADLMNGWPNKKQTEKNVNEGLARGDKGIFAGSKRMQFKDKFVFAGYTNAFFGIYQRHVNDVKILSIIVKQQQQNPGAL